LVRVIEHIARTPSPHLRADTRRETPEKDRARQLWQCDPCCPRVAPEPGCCTAGP